MNVEFDCFNFNEAFCHIFTFGRKLGGKYLFV